MRTLSVGCRSPLLAYFLYVCKVRRESQAGREGEGIRNHSAHRGGRAFLQHEVCRGEGGGKDGIAVFEKRG